MEKPILKENHNSDDVAIYLKELAIYENLEQKNKRPEFLSQIDVQAILKSCENYMDYLHSENYHEDNDYSQYMFEDMMKAVYGNNIFKYINKLTS